MLNIVSVEAHSDRIYEGLYDKLAEQLSTTEKVHLETQHGLDVLYYGRQQVMVLRKVQSSRFPFRELTTLIEEYKGTDLQVWTRIRLNEGQLRKLRTFEAAGAIRFRCFLVSPKVEAHLDYKELERIVKISQNKPLGAEWISEKSIPGFIVNMLNSNSGLNFPIQTLAKVSSADTPPIETPLSSLMRGYYSKLKERAIHWYPKTYVHKAMDEEKWGVDPLPQKEQGKVKRHVLVTGTGRSGTTYFSDLLTLLGLDVGHQRNGNDGCSGAEFAIDSDWYPWFPVYGGGDCANVGERRSDYKYKHVLHIVRHPLWCIPSLMKNYPAINPEFWADNAVMDPIVMSQSSIIRNASMYYGINKRIDESGQAEYRCQLEQIHEHWSRLMEILEMPGTPDPSLKASNQASGWGQYEPLTWAQLELEVGRPLADSIREQAKRYGYE
jgi:hypothetical protein